jgi:hypothetical protein
MKISKENGKLGRSMILVILPRIHYLWVDFFMDGKTRLPDISYPFNPKLVYEKEIGKQINMISQS